MRGGDSRARAIALSSVMTLCAYVRLAASGGGASEPSQQNRKGRLFIAETLEAPIDPMMSILFIAE